MTVLPFWQSVDYVRVYFWLLNLINPWSIHLSLYQAPCCFHYCGFVVSFEIENESSNFVLLSQSCFFAICSPLRLQKNSYKGFYFNFKMRFSIAAKNTTGILIRIALNLHIVRGCIISFLKFLLLLFFNWSIVDFQYCVSFPCAAKRISYTYTYIHSF